MVLYNKLRKTRTYFEDPPVLPPPPPPPPPPVKMFTQAEVDALMQKHRTGLQTQNETLAADLAKMRDKANLTQAEKDELDVRIQNLTQQHMTEAQKLAANADALKKKLETDTATLTAEAKRWQGGFQTLLVKQAVAVGATTHKARSITQMELILLPQAKVVEVADDAGQPTGQFIAKVPLTVIDPKTKKPVVMDLPIPEAIEQMKKMDEFANLFDMEGKGGIGGNSGSGAGKAKGEIDWSKLTPQEHRKLRKEV